MFRGVVCSVLFLTGLAAAESPLHVFYYSGASIEQMSVDGVTVTITLKDAGKVNQVAVYVDNNSPDAVNVIPSDFALHQTTPKDEDLKLKPEQEVTKLGGRNAFGQMVNGMGTGLGRAKDKMTGKEAEPVSATPPDYDAEAQWLAHQDELAGRGQLAGLGHSYLRGSTVFPGAKIFGLLWFDRDEEFNSAVVRVHFGTRSYEFPFPPPSYATTPSNPNQADKLPEQKKASQQPSGRAGVLGISGENWLQDNFVGVRILEVTKNSAAEMAGLRPGFIVTQIDAKKIATTDDLAAALAQKEPGAKIQVTYMFMTRLGWSEKEADVILSVGN